MHLFVGKMLWQSNIVWFELHVKCIIFGTEIYHSKASHKPFCADHQSKCTQSEFVAYIMRCGWTGTTYHSDAYGLCREIYSTPSGQLLQPKSFQSSWQSVYYTKNIPLFHFLIQKIAPIKHNKPDKSNPHIQGVTGGKVQTSGGCSLC